jgi:lipopolysaccharide/colanic/teichoic acid biosynthesis glycosyltransferase
MGGIAIAKFRAAAGESSFASAGADVKDASIASPWSLSLTKRIFDVLAAVAVLTVFSVLILMIALVVRLTSTGKAFFVQDRVGRYGRSFRICKFRTMVTNAEALGAGLTRLGDARITPVGGFLRKFKLDELPQFWNVLRGDMSLVGPRPKLPQFAEMLDLPYRPGITGAATIEFRSEENMLRKFSKTEEMGNFYRERIMPAKARLDSEYMRKCTVWSDLRVILTTIVICFKAPDPEPPLKRIKETRMRAPSL